LLFRNTVLQGTHVKPQRGHGSLSTTLQHLKELQMKTNSIFQHTARLFITRKYLGFINICQTALFLPFLVLVLMILWPF